MNFYFLKYLTFSMVKNPAPSCNSSSRKSFVSSLLLHEEAANLLLEIEGFLAFHCINQLLHLFIREGYILRFQVYYQNPIWH